MIVNTILEWRKAVTLAKIIEKKNTYTTNREKEILKYTLRGHTAKCLLISPRTVELHLMNLKNKFNVNSRSDLIELFN